MMLRPNLCDTCTYCKVIRSDRGSVFMLCRRGLTDSAWPKYPRLPVLRCAGFESASLKTIFLSTYGVLVTSASSPAPEPAAVAALNHLLAETGARLVLTTASSQTPANIAHWGIEGEVFESSTIGAWLGAQPIPPPPDSFVILDVTPGDARFSSRLITVNLLTGLTMAEVHEALQLLRLSG